MAARTTGSDAGVVHRYTAFKAGGVLMTALAGCTGGDVGAWFRNRGHASVGRTAMAAGAAAGDIGMVHRGAGEAGGVAVTGFAAGSRRHVVRWFA